MYGAIITAGTLGQLSHSLVEYPYSSDRMAFSIGLNCSSPALSGLKPEHMNHSCMRPLQSARLLRCAAGPARQTPVSKANLPLSKALASRCSPCFRSGARPVPCRRSVTAAVMSGPTEPTPQDVAARDELLIQLVEAETMEQLGILVADNVMTLDTTFWLNYAKRHDEAGAELKEQLSSLAETVNKLYFAIVKASSEKAEESSDVLQTVLKAAADANGEWHVPLPEPQAAAFRKAMEDNADRLDEGALTNAFAFMRKCQEDGIDDVFLLLQQIVQKIAAMALIKATPATTPLEGSINRIIDSDPNTWEGEVKQLYQSGTSYNELLTALQMRMENLIMEGAVGSHTQRVQAEYLKQLQEITEKAK
mmetsp:Transcript_14568/g.44035  ORF Transcript_14568/g.44035 Transcript_14568/m.44035 type:complete len:364 (-) Transcript_14568:1813-2904(-)